MLDDPLIVRNLTVTNSFTWMIGGPQGSGINSVAENFAKACIRGGLHIFANIEYHSNIKGEHSYYRLRVESKAPRSHVDWVDLLVALDRETIFGDMNKPHPTHRGHRHEVSPGGGIIYDRSLNLAPESFGRDDIKLFPTKLRKQPLSGKRVMIRGVQAVAIAKLKAGCGFQTYYPITPATDESEYLESHQKDYNMIVVQAEDEIAAINMATGAAHAGLRSSTSTSGPGFSLMAEGLGWAGITEAPGPVVILYQRAGPATGLPTRTEQADLRFALHAAHGEFPRIIIAPGDVVETYYDTFDAFNYAEHYQVPVILLTDKFLASTYQDIAPFNGNNLKVDRGDLLQELDITKNPDYKRYQLTELGISPRTRPGQKGGIFWTTGDEHDEYGHITEAAGLRVRMMTKRMKKIELAGQVIPDSKKATLHGPRTAPITIVGWGSTKGAILDGMEELSANGVEANFLQIRYVSPFPTELVQKVLYESRRKIAIENNYSAQMAGLIREMTGIAVDNKIVKFDGRPFSQNEIYEGVRDIVKNGMSEVMLSHA